MIAGTDVSGDGSITPPGDASEAAVVAALERAELAARERRLAAQADADRILADAAATVAAIRAGTARRVEAALTSLREGHLEAAAADVAAIEAELAVVDAGVRDGVAHARVEAAIDEVVGAVLAERGE